MLCCDYYIYNYTHDQYTGMISVNNKEVKDIISVYVKQ